MYWGGVRVIGLKDIDLGIPDDADTSMYQTEADFLNDNIGHLNEKDGINCPICKNRGYFYAMVESYDHAVRHDCECMAKRRAIRNTRNSGLEELLKFTVKDFKTEHEWQKNIKNKAVEYVKTKSKSWFVMLGQPGSGKTHLCSAIAKTWLDAGYEVRYIVWPTYLRELQNKMYGKNDAYAILKEKKVKVLFIDDFLKGSTTENAYEIAFDLLNYRYNNNLTTIISSELLMDELNKRDAAIAGRIYQRSKGYLFQINKNDKNNYRLL